MATVDAGESAGDRLAWVPGAAGLFAMGVGALVLVGWTIESEILKGAGGPITMKANAALGLFLCGLSLLLAANPARTPPMAALTCAALTGLLGFLTFTQHIVGWDLGIDQLLFVEAPGALATASPGRMGVNASFSLTLGSVALLALGRRPSLSQGLAFLMSILAMLALVGYWYGAAQLYSIGRISGIAWPTALTLLVLSLGILSARPKSGPVAALLADGPGGVMARRLMAPAVVSTLALGYIRLLGQRANLYDTGLGLALFATSLVVVFVILIWRTAVALEESHRARLTAERERDDMLVREHAARERAEGASRLKDEFLAMLSHELRTPLNTIVGWTAMMQSNAVPPERRAHAANVVARNGRTLARLVEDLLDVSRITTGQIELRREPVDLTAIAAATAEAIAASAAAEKGVCVRTHFDGAPAVVAGDPDRLQQILGNLLSNAVKFTPAGGAVDVKLQRVEAGVELVVSDSGKGINPEFLPHVFERFRQEDASTMREHGGLGLGLSIVWDLTRLHGGSMHAFSAGPGTGATFTLALPLLDSGGATPTG